MLSAEISSRRFANRITSFSKYLHVPISTSQNAAFTRCSESFVHSVRLMFSALAAVHPCCFAACVATLQTLGWPRRPLARTPAASSTGRCSITTISPRYMSLRSSRRPRPRTFSQRLRRRRQRGCGVPDDVRHASHVLAEHHAAAWDGIREGPCGRCCVYRHF